MKCQSDIAALAEAKLNDAECLLANGRNDNAYYLAGYTIELFLKAKVCKTLNIDDLFDESPTKQKLKNEGTILKPYKVHDYEQLLILSGLYSDFQTELIGNTSFKVSWSIVSGWSEKSRYLTGQTQQSVKDFITSVKEIAKWIQKHL